MGLRTTGNQSATIVSPVAMGFIIEPAGTFLGFALHGLIIWGILGVAMALHIAGQKQVEQPPQRDATPQKAAT
jgi:hypothetical protein